MATTTEEARAQAQQLYISYYGRPGDAGGIDFWTSKFEESDNVDKVLVDFGESDETKKLLSDMGIEAGDFEALVTMLYNQMFNRDPEPEGLAFYVGKLESGEFSVTSAALDIANGATGDDRLILDNKIIVADDFTASTVEAGALYSGDDAIDAGRALLAPVDATDESVTEGMANTDVLVDSLPKVIEGGEYSMDENNPVENFSAATGAVIVTLDGDNDEADFDVTGSIFDDTFILEEFRAANVDGNSGTDTLDLSELSDSVNVNLLGGTFSQNDSGDTFFGTVINVENVVGSDGDDVITGDGADNMIWSGEGDDVLKGGLGDDTFVFENGDDLGTSNESANIDGQVGTDTLMFTGDEIDMHFYTGGLAVEQIVLANAEGEDSVTLDATAEQLGRVVIGSSASDTVTQTDFTPSFLLGSVFVDIEELDLSAGDGTLTINGSTLAGVTVVEGIGTDTIQLGIDSAAGATYDLTGNVLVGYSEVLGSDDSSKDMLVLGQTQIDALLLENVGDSIFGSVPSTGEGLTGANDTLVAATSMDLSDIAGAHLYVRNIDLQGTSIVINDLDESDIDDIEGNAFDNTVVIIDANLANEDYSNNSGNDMVFDSIETIVFDSAGAAITITIDEDTLTGVSTLQSNASAGAGGATLVANVNDITGEEFISLAGMNLDGAFTITGGNWLVAQDTFEDVAAHGATMLTFGDLDLTDAAVTGNFVPPEGEGLPPTSDSSVVAPLGGVTLTAAPLGTGEVGSNYILDLNEDVGNGGTFIGAIDTAALLGNTVIGGLGDDIITLGYDITGASTTTVIGGAGSDLFTISAHSINDLGLGVFLVDFNTGTADDELQIGIGEGFKSASSLFRTFFSSQIIYEPFEASSESATDTNEVDPYTDNGGLRILDKSSNIVTIMPGEALGNAIALRGYASLTSLTEALTGEDFDQAALVNETYVVFAFDNSGTIAAPFGGIFAAVVGAGTNSTNGITSSEVFGGQIATFGSVESVTYSDIVLI